MNNGIIVSQATIQDLDDLVPVFDQYRAFYEQPSDVEAARSFLFDKFEHRESVVFIAREDETGALIGFTQLYPTFSSLSMRRSWILNDLFVVEAFRKRGVAGKLMNQAAEFGVLTNGKGIELMTAQDNLRAQRLYESLGYRKEEGYYHYDLTL